MPPRFLMPDRLSKGRRKGQHLLRPKPMAADVLPPNVPFLQQRKRQDRLQPANGGATGNQQRLLASFRLSLIRQKSPHRGNSISSVAQGPSLSTAFYFQFLALPVSGSILGFSIGTGKKCFHKDSLQRPAFSCLRIVFIICISTRLPDKLRVRFSSDLN